MTKEQLNTSMGFLGGFKQEVPRVNRTKKSISELEQFHSLKKFLIQAKNTEFGNFHSFMVILNSADPVNMYKACTLLSYDGTYDNWIEHSMNGLKNVTWPGPTFSSQYHRERPRHCELITSC